MKYLEAHHPNGKLHGCTCATNSFEERYRRTMRAQGLTVTAYTMDEARELLARRREQVKAPQQTQISEDVPSPLPHVGQTILHDLLGPGIVTHTVTLDGEAVPVMVGQRGSGLVRAGSWQADVSNKTESARHIPPTCRPNEHDQSDVSNISPKIDTSAEPVKNVYTLVATPTESTPGTHLQPAEQSNHSPLPDAPKPSRMQPLF